MLTSESAKIILKNAGVRLTPQRMMIVDVLVGNRSHPTVDEVYAHVHASYPTISLATVYHTLAKLAEYGLILELRGGKDGLRCDPETTQHAHAYCDGCGAVSDIALPELPNWDPARIAGFQTRMAEISLFGLCEKCSSS